MQPQIVELLEQACSYSGRAAVASALDVDPKTITRWKTGKTPPPVYVLPALQNIIHKASPSHGKSDFTFIDLFAGVGGIRLGFEAAGGQCVFTSEWNEFSQKTYLENFGNDHLIKVF
jgi:DNA (cytosine-5)-methyltransferase 1